MPLSIIPRPQPIWIEPETMPDDFDWKQLHSQRLIATLLYRRGLRTAEAAMQALKRDDPAHLDYHRLPNIDAALDRVELAIRNREHIGIFGDYDADGITSATLLTRALRSAAPTSQITPFVPSRTDGYGVSERGVRLLAEQGCTLLIAVDTGTNDAESIDLAMQLGMDVVVLDHHEVSAHPADCIIVNPKIKPATSYPELVGVGVAWFFAMGLLDRGHDIARLDGGDVSAMLDLVAIGTVADVGALRGANRALVAHGLERLHRSERPGTRALTRYSNIPLGAVTAEDISFRLGPRLNATGRVASPEKALKMMLAEDDDVANRYGIFVEQCNANRKAITDQIMREVAHKILNTPDWESLPIIALYGDDWNTGLVGPIASKIAERLGVPAIVMQHQDGVLTGSGRSVPGVNLLEIISHADSLLTRYGGHAGAGGVTLPLRNYHAFVDTITAAASHSDLHLPQPPTITLDAWLPEEAFRLSIVDMLDELAPFGHGNAFPTFGARQARLISYTTMGQDGSHLKLMLGTRGRELQAILWGGAHRSKELVGATHVDVCGKLSVNTFQGQRNLQMLLEDFRRAE
ncbi:MAG: single-stranded-DNA-specific exonuclease RecJ [Thermomicrobiales bacterium]|nr:single-stranded-DNA-specific exonuclease RecJ [Thermomicrobiales bacterium]MCO5218377.1 single-stranded-DNA-specific exonuclease RecJ [Thermomicrobiales bacterium]MCO5227097.1 single-stranded-DNA-specific exonuclease RecJ [Thermomicrobiales bacterium]